MLNIKRYAIVLASVFTLTLACPLTTFAMEGLADLQEETTNVNTGLSDVNELEAGSTSATEPSGEEDDYKGGTTIDTGNAIDDILNNERYAGAISSIKKVTDIFDGVSIKIISLVAFFIISAAMLKNVCAGAYVANPKFWDKVHTAHERINHQSIAGLRNLGSAITNAEFSTIGDTLLAVVPDLKTYTDFEDGDASSIDPKAYFSKSIPAMLFCVIIGIFIYNGYYRDTASKVGSFGAESFERFIGEADPIALADRIYNTTGKPTTKYDGDTSLKGKIGKALADKSYSLYVSTYHDISGAGTKAKLMQAIVEDVDSMLAQSGEFLKANAKTSTGYEYSYTVAVSKSIEGNVSPVVGPGGNKDSKVVRGVFALHDNDDLGIHWTAIDSSETGMTAVAYKITFTKNNDEFLENTSGVVTVYFNSQSDEVSKDTLNSELNNAGFQALNKGTNVKYKYTNTRGTVRQTDGDKVYRLTSEIDSSVQVGKVKIEVKADEE